MTKSHQELRARRDAQARASAKKRQAAERERVQKPWKDLASPIGFGPLHEALSPQRHITRDPGDESAPAHQQHSNPFKKSPWE
jgi:hypothetical protein